MLLFCVVAIIFGEGGIAAVGLLAKLEKPFVVNPFTNGLEGSLASVVGVVAAAINGKLLFASQIRLNFKIEDC